MYAEISGYIIISHEINGHRFLIRGYIWDYTKLPSGTSASTVNGPFIRTMLTVAHVGTYRDE